jgi:AraC-like DNA-binding protein
MADRNFFDFVNRYRIEAAQKILRDETKGHQSVHFIGETVGFKSKSAFYAAFKKHTGCTPAEFRKSTMVD